MQTSFATKDNALSSNKGKQSKNQKRRLTLTKFCKSLSKCVGWDITPDNILGVWDSGFELSIPELINSVIFDCYYASDQFIWRLCNADLTLFDYWDLQDYADSFNAIMDYLNKRKINLGEINASDNE